MRIYEAPIATCPGCGSQQPYEDGYDGQCRTTWHERGRKVRVSKRLAWWVEWAYDTYASDTPLTAAEALETWRGAMSKPLYFYGTPPFSAEATR